MCLLDKDPKSIIIYINEKLAYFSPVPCLSIDEYFSCIE